MRVTKIRKLPAHLRDTNSALNERYPFQLLLLDLNQVVCRLASVLLSQYGTKWPTEKGRFRSGQVNATLVEYRSTESLPRTRTEFQLNKPRFQQFARNLDKLGRIPWIFGAFFVDTECALDHRTQKNRYKFRNSRCGAHYRLGSGLGIVSDTTRGSSLLGKRRMDCFVSRIFVGRQFLGGKRKFAILEIPKWLFMCFHPNLWYLTHVSSSQTPRL